MKDNDSDTKRHQGSQGNAQEQNSRGSKTGAAAVADAAAQRWWHSSSDGSAVMYKIPSPKKILLLMKISPDGTEFCSHFTAPHDCNDLDPL